MKQFLLSATLLTSLTSFGQFTQANEPQLGANVMMYVLDSNAVDYSALTGTAQTWDYSTTPGIYGSTKTITVIDPTGSANYGTSTKGIQIPNFITSYFTSTATQRVSQGFSFEDQSVGSIDLVLSADNETVMNYPFAQGNTLTDAFSGNAITTLPSPLDNIPTTGSVTASVDGTGTLKLGNSTNLMNVIRYKIVETATANAGIITVDILRTQYEYYDLANSNLPVLVHSQLTINGTSQSLVMSSVAPDEYLAVNESEKVSFQMYPNPATSSLTLGGLTGNETIQIVDMSGRVVMTTQATSTTTTIALDGLKGGIYTVMVNNSVQRLTIK